MGMVPMRGTNHNDVIIMKHAFLPDKSPQPARESAPGESRVKREVIGNVRNRTEGGDSPAGRAAPD